MSDEGLLNKFVDETYGSGSSGSVSTDDRATIFANVARFADEETAAKFAQAVESSTNDIDGYERMMDFADAVATHAPPDEKLEFIQTLASESPQGAQPDYRSDFAGYSTSIQGDKDAAAIAVVLGSMPGAHAQDNHK